MKKVSFFIILVTVVAVYFISGYKRVESYKKWQEQKNVYFVDNIPAMTTLDAYYWLKIAKDYDNHKLGKDELNILKTYPDGERFMNKAPMLPRLISLVHETFELDYYRAGLFLIPFLAGLFCIPLFFYMQNIGYGSTAVLGGLIGSFSYSYYARSMMGRVDTDMLNIFFPILISLFILLVKKDNSLRRNLFFSALSGIAMFMFIWWYEKTGFILIYMLFFLIYLLLQRVKIKEIVLILLTFCLASNPIYTLGSFSQLSAFLTNYFFPKPSGQISWPDIMGTITESQKRGFAETLDMIFPIKWVSMTGLLGIVYLYVRRLKQMLPISPIIVLGALSFVGSNRFAMYITPFIGAGIGVIIYELISFTSDYLMVKRDNTVLKTILSIVLMAIFFTLTAKYTGFNHTPQPSISSKIVNSFIELKNKLPEHSAMFSWWDYGYALMDIPEFATYHDGGAHGWMRTTIAAIGMVADSQSKLYNMLSFLEDKKFKYLEDRVIKDNITPDAMLKEVYEYDKPFSGENVYLLYTEDMIGKYGAISFFGNWDFEKKSTNSSGYNNLRCNKIENRVIYCGNININIANGIIESQGRKISMKKSIFVNNGYVTGDNNYSDRGPIIQILMKNNSIFSVQYIDDKVYNSNFNQHFILGKHDEKYFREAYNNFPIARVFEVVNQKKGE